MRNRYRRMTDLAVVLAVAVGVAACEVGDAPLDVSGDHPVLNFETVLGDPAVLPAGNTSVAVGIGGFDLAMPDGFARSTGALGLYNSNNPFGFPAFDVEGGIRNSSQDPRVPNLAPSSASVGSATFGVPFCVLGAPPFGGVGEGLWDLFCDLAGLAPSTTYTIALARMALTVNAEVDNAAVLLGQPIADPDELTFLGGTEGGDETAICDFTTPVAFDASTNPVALGTVTSDASGNALVDCIPNPTGTSPWWRSIADPNPPAAEDSVPFGRNEAGTVVPGQYNYILIIEGVGTAGNPVPDAPPTVRIQMGPDIDATGTVTNNTFAPFPLTNVNPNTVTSLPGGAAAFATPVGVTLTFANLPMLSSGSYKAFLTKVADGSAAAATGEHSVDATTATEAAFNSPDVSATHTLVVDPVSAGVPLGDFDRVVISVESDAGAASPANPFLIFDYLDDRGTADQQDDLITQAGDMLFGAPGSGKRVARTGIAGSGLGQIFRDSLIVSLRRLGRTAAGWSYYGYLVDESRDGLARELPLGVVTPNESGDVDVRIAVDASGNLVSGGSGTPDVTGLANYNLFILNMQPMGMGGSDRSTLFRFQISDDYRNKYSDFFSPGQ